MKRAVKLTVAAALVTVALLSSVREASACFLCARCPAGFVCAFQNSCWRCVPDNSN